MDTSTLTTCTANALFQWLLQNRFNNDRAATAAFLKTAALTATATAVPVAASIPNATTPTETESLIQQPVEIAFTTPRGKFQVDFLRATSGGGGSSGGMQCRDAKGHTFVIAPSSAVQHAVIFPKPADCQAVQRKNVVLQDQVLLVFGTTATNSANVVWYKNKPLAQVCLSVPAAEHMPVWKTRPDNNTDNNADNNDNDGLDRTDQFTQFLTAALDLAVDAVVRVANPAAATSHFWQYQFRSHAAEGTSTTTSNMPFVQCYAGVQDGVLFPLQQGLLFYKPCRFVPRSQLASIACGRTGGNAGRYVDMTVTLNTDNNNNKAKKKETTLEFTNIHRSELTVLREYIHGVLIPAMQKDVADGENTGGDVDGDAVAVAAVAGNDGNNQDSSSSDSGQVVAVVAGGRPGKRKASVQARAINQRMRLDDSDDDEEEDDGDYVIGEKDDDDDDGSSTCSDDDGDDNGGGEQVDADDDTEEVVEGEAEDTESEEDGGEE
jgi:hypothetical protein